MHRYQFIQNPQKGPVILNYGQLGACQLLLQRDTNQLCILKLAPKSQALKDVQYLTQMNHPNIIKVLDFFDHEDNTLIIFQFLANGDLYTKIKCKEIKSYQIPSIFRGICMAIHYVHSKKIIHRNLKSETILLDQNMNPKIIDFGLAARLSTRKTFCGCFNYMAPQILNNRQYNDKADVWALGAILYEMVYGDVPFPGDNTYQVANSIKESHVFWKKFSPGSVEQLINWMLSEDMARRPTVSQVLNHSYLKSQPLHSIQLHSRNVIQNNKQKIVLKVYDRKKTKLNQSKQSKHKDHSTCKQKLECIKVILNNKIKALKDGQRIKDNPHYNFVADI